MALVDFPLLWFRAMAWLSLPSNFISLISLAASVIAFSTTFYDRRRRIDIRFRKGQWLVLEGPAMLGHVEIYNASSRSNSVRAYHFSTRNVERKWVPLESERMEIGSVIHNETPLVIPPYSGVAVPIGCFANWEEFPCKLAIMISVEDIFGRNYPAETELGNRFSRNTPSIK